MNKGEQIFQIKQALKNLFNLTEDKMKEDTEMEKKEFQDYDLQDGTKLTTSSATLEVGAEVYGINLDGDQYPLNNNEYKLADGRVVSVEDNKVKSISEPAETKDSPVTDADLEKVKMEEMPVGEESVEIEVEDAEVAPSAEERIAKLEEIIGKILMGMDDMKKMNEEMMGNMKKFSEEPATESIKMERGIATSVDPKEFSKRKNQSELLELRELIKKSRNENNNTKI